MPFDHEKWGRLASQGDVAGIAITTVVALYGVRQALQNIQSGKDIADQIKQIESSIDSLDKIFVELTGYTSNGE